MRLERSWALDEEALAGALAELDPSWGTETHALAGGRLVLCGPGLYVNRGLALGLDVPLSQADIEFVQQRSAAVGVPPAIDVTDATHPATVRFLVERGFACVEGEQTTATVRALDEIPSPDDDRIAIALVRDRSLEEWQATSALGWGHATEASRRAADIYARAAHRVDGDGMVLAVDRSDGRALGVASLTIREGIATLGGMSTVPAERGRGVQSALIRYRLAAAREAGCAIATSTARSGGASERNLLRHGFRPLHVKRTYVRSVTEAPGG